MRIFISIICLTNMICLYIFSRLSEEEGKDQKLTEALASGETLVRKLHKIRNKEVCEIAHSLCNYIQI